MTILNKSILSNLFVSTSKLANRHLWGYVAIAFNKVDYDRLKLVGPDRLCAEWLLKNGGGVRLVGMAGKLLRDYNVLPPESQRFRIQVVDASKSSVMKIGLEHFKGCDYIDTVIFHDCKHLESDALDGLRHLTNTLKMLQVSGCYNISDDGLKVIGDLKNLRQLKVFDMPYVKNMDAVVKELKQALPQCQIDTAKPE